MAMSSPNSEATPCAAHAQLVALGIGQQNDADFAPKIPGHYQHALQQHSEVLCRELGVQHLQQASLAFCCTSK